MIKTLLKKQWIGTLSVFTIGKDGKKRSPKVAIAFAVLIVYALFSIGLLFWEMADMLCAPLVNGGMAWVYFAMMGTMATAFGLTLSMFTAKARLYEAKDNDLLLSMPIPTWVILFIRTVGLYGFTFLIEGLVFVPALIRYFTIFGFSVIPFLCSLVGMVILPFLALAVSYILGWLIAFIGAKLPGKNLLVMLFAVVFMVGYYALYSKVNEYLGYVITHGEAVGKVMKTSLYPFSQLGKACAGDGVALLIYALIFVGVFALVYLLMSATYLRLATMNKGMKKTKYTGKGYNGTGYIFALVKKELLRFSKNPMVMLNCFMGSVALLLIPIVSLFKKDMLLQVIPAFKGDFSLVVAALICLLAATNLLTCCSISLEGNSLDVLRVLPLETEKVLLGKWLMGALASGVPAIFAWAVLCIQFKIEVAIALCVLLVALIFVAMSSAMGLAINLLFPNLKWTNEVAVVKQSVASLVSMFSGFAAVALLVGGYFLFGKYLPAWGYLLVCTAVVAITFAGICFFLKKKGTKIFEGL